MNETADGELYRRLDNLERKMDVTSSSLISHLASCERLGQAASESRTRVELALAAMTVKIDGLIRSQDQQVGALKLSKWLWGAIVAIGAFIGWSASHFSFIK